jgi:adenylosuccinate synthase
MERNLYCILFHQVFCTQYTIVVIGNGTVIDPDALINEINTLDKKGIEVKNRLLISHKAHLIMPYHKLIDTLSESSRSQKAIGTTGRGIGPAYIDKFTRVGIRNVDYLIKKNLLQNCVLISMKKIIY